ncbi:MAG: hybrid sensor histidine kinase/response regulator [Methanomicrobiales archaeon]|nr:hybrid sensor histidine kinase/response regulator [Methanomicrobiales archaeon]
MQEMVRVLLIEDDPVFVRYVQEMFQELPQNHFSLQHADRLSKGLDQIKGKTFDVVLLDLMLPDSERLETVRRVVRHAPQVPIVILTTLRDEQTGVTAVQIGAQDFLVKAEVNSELLSRAIRYAMERKQIEEAVKQANRNLNLMNSITRHDILNQLTIILGYLPLAREMATDGKQKDYLEKIEKAADAIHHQIDFTRDYQSIGAHTPQWQNIRETIRNAVRNQDLGKVSLHIDLKDREVYADPMLEKVFYNLLDNALRHGEHVTAIHVSCREDGDGLHLVWEDNGIGVPAEEKSRIFRRGVGKNQGLGLFLIRSILDITNITIQETGEPGKGARFEMQVPRGYFRIGAGQSN